MEKSAQLISVSDLTIEEKIGQLVLAQAFGRFRSTSASEYKPLAHLVQKHHLSGFKLYHGYGLGTLMFVSHIEKQARLPLFFASDLETGLGQQIVDAPRFPSIAALGAIRDFNLAYKTGYTIAQEALRLGINLIFAPLLDLHTQTDSYFGNRSIGHDPILVAEIGAQITQGISKAGAISTAKYFPGNGNQVFCQDGSTIINTKHEQLYNHDWIPFKKAISANVDAIMVSHGAFPSLDDSKWNSQAGVRPAALSHQIVTGILRNELGFEGIIVTDALNLPFLRKHSIRKVACEAISAGSDLLVALTTPQDATEAIKGVHDALDKGVISETQVDQSVERILKAKSKMGKNHLGKTALSKRDNAVGEDRTIKLIEEIAHRAVTLLKKPETGFPIKKRPVAVSCVLIGPHQTIEHLKADPWQPWHIHEPMQHVTINWTAIDPRDASSDSQWRMKINWISTDFIVIIPLQIDRDTKQLLDLFLNVSNNFDKKMILALPLSPNDANLLSPRSWASLWLPDFYQASRQALLSIILGESQPSGVL